MRTKDFSVTVLVVFLTACGQEENGVDPIAHSAPPTMQQIYDELTFPGADSVRGSGQSASSYGGFFINPATQVGSCPVNAWVSAHRGTRIARMEGGQLVADTTVVVPTKFTFTIADLNGDRQLDFIGTDPTGGGQWPMGTLWWGQANGVPTPALDRDGRVQILDYQESASPYPFDVNGDGRLDLIVPAGLYCQNDKLFKIFYQMPSGNFEEDPEALRDIVPCNSGYAVWVGRAIADGTLTVAVLGSSGSAQGEEARPGFFCQVGLTPRENPQFGPCSWEPKIQDGPDGYKNFQIPCLSDAFLGAGPCVIDFNAREGNAHMNRNAPMGIAVADVTGTGALGFVVATDPMLVTFTQKDRQWIDLTPVVNLPLEQAHTAGSLLPWGIQVFDCVGDGAICLLVAAGNDEEEWMNDVIGPQPIKLFVKRGEQFDDVSVAAGLGQTSQWKSVAVGDMDCDGRPDIMVGGQGRIPKIFHHRDIGNNWVSLALRGNASAPLGMDAVIMVESEGIRTQRLVVGNTGGSVGFSQPQVFAGIGMNTHARRIIIKWPSGTKQILVDVVAGFHEILEPESGVAP